MEDDKAGDVAHDMAIHIWPIYHGLFSFFQL
jgi:hypothetical protein